MLIREDGRSVNEGDQRFRSPWLEQLEGAGSPRPLDQSLAADVVVVGAGIAGIASAYFILKHTSSSVILVERSLAGHGASGRNAGQLVTYFERPLCSLVDEHGFALATRAQAEIEMAWDLLDDLLSETGIAVPIERFDGAMGMYSLNHVLVHLRNQHIRRRAGLPLERIEVSDRATFLGAIPEIYRDLFDLVPQALIQSRLTGGNDEYPAVLRSRKGCANSALLCQKLLGFLQATYADRFSYYDHTTVDRIVLGVAAASVHCGRHRIAASRVVVCTNGFNHHTVENTSGEQLGSASGTMIEPVIGYMAGVLCPPGADPEATSYIRNAEIGGRLPYFYSTRRQYDLGGASYSLVCLGGPESEISEHLHYDPDSPVPSGVMQLFDGEVRPVVAPGHPAGRGYDFAWHGLMGYTKGKMRVVGFEPKNPVLMYNLGCNGVGFLPSIAGGRRIADLHKGVFMEPSLFDPK